MFADVEPQVCRFDLGSEQVHGWLEIDGVREVQVQCQWCCGGTSGTVVTVPTEILIYV